MSTIEQGVVVESTGALCEVKTNNGTIQCRVRGKLRLKGVKTTNPIAVGDNVRFERINDREGVIVDVLERKNYIIRKSVNKSKEAHIIASNIDLAVILFTFRYPRTSLGFVDRFLVVAESFQIPSLVLVNKIDILEEEDVKVMEELEVVYKSIQVDFLGVSALKGIGIENLKEKLSNKTSLIVGHSGTGKSTILNRICPNINQKTADISSFSKKGTHITTFAKMFEVTKNTNVVDTPGVKEFGLIDFKDNEIALYFPEFKDLLSECTFYNCTHIHEPKCAVIKAVKEGKIAMSRYESYLSIMKNL